MEILCRTRDPADLLPAPHLELAPAEKQSLDRNYCSILCCVIRPCFRAVIYLSIDGRPAISYENPDRKRTDFGRHEFAFLPCTGHDSPPRFTPGVNLPLLRVLKKQEISIERFFGLCLCASPYHRDINNIRSSWYLYCMISHNFLIANSGRFLYRKGIWN